jgi:hypothetical protein
MTTEYRPLILHVSHGSARGDVAQNGVAQLSLHTSVDALADGLLNLYRTDATAAQVLGEVLARLAGVTEYTAVMGTDAERWNALLLEQMERVATLTRERDEARALIERAPIGTRLLALGEEIQSGDMCRKADDPSDSWEHTGLAGSEYSDETFIYCRKIDTPTPGAQP